MKSTNLSKNDNCILSEQSVGSKPKKKKIRFNLAILMSFIIVCVVLTAIVVCKSTPQYILSQNITNYEYFLADRAVTLFENPIMGQGDFSIRIETSVSTDKTQDLINSSVLNDCLDYRYTCPQETWPKAAKTIPGEYCTSASDKSSPNDIKTTMCINTNTGFISFSKTNF